MTAVRRRIKKITGILNAEQTEIVNTALWLMIPSLLTKITGQLFNLIAASYFGTDDPGWNNFIIANTIPELLTTVLMVGAIGAVIIPVLLACKTKEGEESFYRVYSSIINTSVLAFSGFALLLIIFGDSFFPVFLKYFIRPTTPISPDEIKEIVNMMRVLLIPQLILGISVFISSGLNVYNRYIVPQLSPLLYNVGRIAVIFTLVPLMNYSPWALVIGVIVGSLLHLIVQIPFIYALRIKYYFSINFNDIYIREVLRKGLPRMLALASDQIAFAFNKFLAFAFQGAAAFTFATSLYLVVPALFGYTFSYASYPTLSRLFIEQDFPKIRSVVIKTINEVFFLSIPFVVAIMVLRVPIVRLAYGIIPGTELDLEGTYQVAWILLWFTPGLVFITARWFVLSLYYAAKDTMTPFIVTAFSLFGVIGLSYLLTNFFSYNQNYAISTIPLELNNFLIRSDSKVATGGISLAMSIVYTIEFFALLFIFNKRKLNIGLRKLIKTSMKKFIAGFVMFVFLYLTYKIWNVISYLPNSANNGYTGSTTLNLLILTLITLIPGFLLYYLICHLLKVEELKIMRKYLNPIFKIGGLRIRD